MKTKIKMNPITILTTKITFQETIKNINIKIILMVIHRPNIRMKVIKSIQIKKIKDKIILDKNHLWRTEVIFQTEAGFTRIQDKNNLFLDIPCLNKM